MTDLYLQEELQRIQRHTGTFSSGNTGEYREIHGNTGKYRRTHENTGECGRIKFKTGE